MNKTWITLLLAFAMQMPTGLPLDPERPPGAAWADDHDDDDDDDDDDDGPRRPAPSRDDDDDDDDDAPRRPAQVRPADPVQPADPPPPRAAAPAAPAPAAPLPDRRPDEVVVVALDDAALATLTAQGFEVIEERDVPAFGGIIRRLRVPGGLTLEEARDIVRAVPGGEDADFNHYYRGSQAEIAPAGAATEISMVAPCDGPHCQSFDQIGWPAVTTRAPACGVPVTVGMVDTGINPDHTTFAGARIEVLRLTEADLDPSGEQHGTAVAAMLVGAPDSRSPGLVPWAQLVAVDAFHRSGGDERADVFTLVAGLDHLSEAGARVVNLSLAGPPNTVLEQTVARLVAAGIVVVAAAGNGGPRAGAAYPAAYDGVIAVSAVDAGNTVYRRAQQGDHIDPTAPGVEVWTAASISGARTKTGTSFAAPFVTAASALVLQQRPALTPFGVEAALIARALDLGEPGRDPVHGAGLLQATGLCPGG